MLEMYYCGFHQLVKFDTYMIADNQLFWRISKNIYKSESSYMSIDLDKKRVFIDLEIWENCQLEKDNEMARRAKGIRVEEETLENGIEVKLVKSEDIYSGFEAYLEFLVDSTDGLEPNDRRLVVLEAMRFMKQDKRIIQVGLQPEECPFCGETEAGVVNVGADFVVECDNCHAKGPNMSSSEEAITAWNESYHD